MILSPSMLSSDFSRMGDELAALKEAGISWVHWDVMDGSFVPNITFGPPVIKNLRKRSDLFFDVHLMIREPERHLEAFADAGADMLVVHAEACLHLHRTLGAIRELGMRAGLALNPATPVTVLEHVMDLTDMVLIMTVNPGFGGQKFIASGLAKIRAARTMLNRQERETLLQADGGISPENAGEIVMAGASVLVAGSAFFNGAPYRERREAFEKALA
ncbi:MAG: ribulose-phosphate 3-epimerase [Deltaproteobacteria bacterium]|nr:ribulose-phosphate 3-epimerase [Deltaproteobacteria bacterium]